MEEIWAYIERIILSMRNLESRIRKLEGRKK